MEQVRVQVREREPVLERVPEPVLEPEPEPVLERVPEPVPVQERVPVPVQVQEQEQEQEQEREQERERELESEWLERARQEFRARSPESAQARAPEWQPMQRPNSLLALLQQTVPGCPRHHILQANRWPMRQHPSVPFDVKSRSCCLFLPSVLVEKTSRYRLDVGRAHAKWRWVTVSICNFRCGGTDGACFAAQSCGATVVFPASERGRSLQGRGSSSDRTRGCEPGPS